MNPVDYDAAAIRLDNVRLLRPITQRVMQPLEAQALDEYTALITKFEDAAHEEEKLQKQLRLLRAQKDALWIRIQAIHDGRTK